MSHPMTPNEINKRIAKRKPMTQKKRWKPKNMTKCWYIYFDGSVHKQCHSKEFAEVTRGYLGVYKTKIAAIKMSQAIKDFVTKKIGGV